MDRLTLEVVINGKAIKSGCALSTTHQQIHFEYEGKYHTITYKQTKRGCYILFNGVRCYFKVYDNVYNKWIIDCAYF